MSASVPDACEVLPGKSPRFNYHTREKRNRAYLRWRWPTSTMRLAGAYAKGGLPPRAISRTTFKCTVRRAEASRTDESNVGNIAEGESSCAYDVCFRPFDRY